MQPDSTPRYFNHESIKNPLKASEVLPSGNRNYEQFLDGNPSRLKTPEEANMIPSFTMDYETRLAEKRRSYKEEQRKLLNQKQDEKEKETVLAPQIEEESTFMTPSSQSVIGKDHTTWKEVVNSKATKPLPDPTDLQVEDGSRDFTAPISRLNEQKKPSESMEMRWEDPERNVSAVSKSRMDEDFFNTKETHNWQHDDKKSPIYEESTEQHLIIGEMIQRKINLDDFRWEDYNLEPKTEIHTKNSKSLRGEKSVILHEAYAQTIVSLQSSFPPIIATLEQKGAVEPVINESEPQRDKINTSEDALVSSRITNEKLQGIRANPSTNEIPKNGENLEIVENETNDKSASALPNEKSDTLLERETNSKEKESYAAYLMLDSGALIGPFLYETFLVENKLPDGIRNRAFNSTNPNEHSSRSHSMLTVMIDSEIQDPEDEAVYYTKHGKLTFVDLAGSEKVKDGEKLSPDQLLETNNINKSLLVLSNCISALSDPKRRNGHIPYRDSKLTKLLADSLGGNGITLMIACVSGEISNSSETMNTMRYASRAKKIQNQPTIKIDAREEQIQSLKKEVKILKKENHVLRSQLPLVFSAQDVNHSFNLPSKTINDIQLLNTPKIEIQKNLFKNNTPYEFSLSKPASQDQPRFTSKQQDEIKGFDKARLWGEEIKMQGETKEQDKTKLEKETKERDKTKLEEETKERDKTKLEEETKERDRTKMEEETKERDRTKLKVETKEQKDELKPMNQSDEMQQTNNSLYEMLQEYMVENETLRTENSDLAKYRERVKRDQEILARENELLARRIEELQKSKDENYARRRVAYVLPGSRKQSGSNDVDRKNSLIDKKIPLNLSDENLNFVYDDLLNESNSKLISNAPIKQSNINIRNNLPINFPSNPNSTLPSNTNSNFPSNANSNLPSNSQSNTSSKLPSANLRHDSLNNDMLKIYNPLNQESFVSSTGYQKQPIADVPNQLTLQQQQQQLLLQQQQLVQQQQLQQQIQQQIQQQLVLQKQLQDAYQVQSTSLINRSSPYSNTSMRPPAHLAHPTRPPHRLPAAASTAAPPDFYDFESHTQRAPEKQSYSQKYDKTKNSPKHSPHDIDNMNEKLRKELYKLDGLINQHQRTNALHKDIHALTHKRTI